MSHPSNFDYTLYCCYCVTATTIFYSNILIAVFYYMCFLGKTFQNINSILGLLAGCCRDEVERSSFSWDIIIKVLLLS